jgi:outer membrane protein TolC
MKKIIITLLSAVLFQFVYAQEDTLLIHYRQKAVEYQQQVKVAQHRLSGAESKVEAAKSDYLPQLDFIGRYRYYVEPMQLAPPADGSSTIGEEINNFYSLRLELYQPLYTGGQLSSVKNAALSEVEMMKNFIGLRRQQVMLDSDILYWKAVSKKETYNLHIKYREIIAQFLKVINDRVTEEIVGKNELYQAKVRYNDAQYKTIRSKKEYQVSVMNLSRLCGLPLDSNIPISDSLIVADWTGTETISSDSAYANRPEIGLYKNLISKDEYKERLVGSTYNPNLGIIAGGKWGSPSPGLNIDPGFNYYIKANLSIPLIRWGKKSEEVFAARQITEVAKLKMAEAKDNIRLEVERSSYKLKISKEQLDFAKSSLHNAAQNVSVMMDRYNEGLSSVLEVLDAQLYWQKTYLNYILAKYEFNVAYSEYLYAGGEFNKMSK